MDKRYWDLKDIISKFGSDAFCDWESAPSISWENRLLFKTVIDTARMLAMDGYRIRQYGAASCRILMNCLVDITLMSLSDEEAPGVYEAIERTYILFGFLTCRRYLKSTKNWIDPTVQIEMLKALSEEAPT